MKVKIDYSTGNFTLNITGNVDTGTLVPIEPLITVITNGIRYATERDIASVCYKELAGKGGKLPKGFKRETLGFSEENATLFQAVATRELRKLMPDAVVTVGQNVGGAMADAELLMSDHESRPNRGDGTSDLVAWLRDNIGYVGETHGDDGEFASGALVAIAQKLKAKREAAKRAEWEL